MANKLTSITIAIALMACSTLANAQKVYKEGVVELSMLTAQGTTFGARYYFNADSVSLTFNMILAKLGRIYTANSDYDASLLDIPTKKVKRAAVATPEDIAKLKAYKPKLTFATTTDQKVISGFNCKRLAVTNTKSGKQFDLWITNDYTLPLAGLTKFYAEATGGIPIQYFMLDDNGDTTSQLTVKSITEQKTPAGTFTIPADFEIVTKEELFSND